MAFIYFPPPRPKPFALVPGSRLMVVYLVYAGVGVWPFDPRRVSGGSHRARWGAGDAGRAFESPRLIIARRDAGGFVLPGKS